MSDDKKRQFFVAGNWKMYGTKANIDEVAQFLNNATLDQKTEIVVAPPAAYLDYARQVLKPDIGVAAQNCYKDAKGAFTGETSTSMAVDCGCTWLIVGNSERRQLFGESDEMVGDKVKRGEFSSLSMILCVGETLLEREAGISLDVVHRQLRSLADNITDWERVVIAYEPVWAMRTGKCTLPDQVQDMHAAIREWLWRNISDVVAYKTRVIYGGLVTANNCREIGNKLDVDGFLVGGASLRPGEFVNIINSRTY